MITEIATFYLKEVGSLAELNSSASKLIREFIAPELIANGARDIYYGQFIEKPEMAILFGQWESLQAHKDFMSSPKYKAHATYVNTIIDGSKPASIIHVPFKSSDNPSPALGANSKVGATEVVFVYFPSTLTSTGRDSVISAYDKMRPVIERSESLGIYDGWAVEEEVANPGPQASEGEKSKVYVSLVGWAEVDAHARFMKTEDFLQNIHHLLEMKEMRHHQIYHVKLEAA
ncbi:hypothetical protein MMC14_010441 [Varicellaria rhodocarpa]|nr:hypothetical protein [Varicellaria rhodocarpa]